MQLRRQQFAARAWSRVAVSEPYRVYALTLVIGVVCGLTAVAFHGAIRWASQALIERSLDQPGSAWMVWALLTPSAGALLSGVLLEYLLPNARGSGIPQVKFAYAAKAGTLRLRDALGKFGLATLQLGTGSALGREGPTVQICASVASWLGRVFSLSPASARRLIPLGAAAGIAAAFNAPIAAVTFTLEEIVGDLDQSVLAGVVVAAALAAVVERSILGVEPVFSVPHAYQLDDSASLLVYTLLGLAAGLLSRLFYLLLLSGRARVRSLSRVQRAIAPAFGGLATGALAVLVGARLGAQGVLGDGYQSLSAALAGELPMRVMLALLAAKLLATVCCYASGGAGGIFAPVLFVGAMLGGAFGQIDRVLLDHPGAELGAFALVGMGAFFAAVIRAPITSVLIIFELTHSYGLILPLMIANTTAYLCARDGQRVPIYEALLDQDGLHLPAARSAGSAVE